MTNVICDSHRHLVAKNQTPSNFKPEQKFIFVALSRSFVICHNDDDDHDDDDDDDDDDDNCDAANLNVLTMKWLI